MRACLAAVLVAAALVAGVSSAPNKALPSTWSICKRSDKNLAQCMQEAVGVAVQDLANKGSKSLGVPPIDPLRISNLNIDQGNGPVSIALNFSNLEISGFKAAKVGLVNADLDKWTFSAPVTLPLVELIGDYEINGKVLILPIRGKGKCDVKLERPNATVHWTAKEVQKDGVSFLHLEDFAFLFDAQHVTLYFENLFNGNKQLGDQMNVFLNENWEQILGELKPAIQEAFGIAFRDITNRIFSRVPLIKMFPQ